MNQTAPNWSQIDTSTGSDYFVRYLETATAQTEMQRYKQRSYDLLGATTGKHLLDVGCGIGDDALALAERVGSQGRVIGIDCSAKLITEAQHRVKSLHLSLEFQVGDVSRLEFPDESFDGCRADRVFMHLADRQQALGEMIRVTRLGGRILVREPDWETLLIDSSEPDLTRQILNAHFTQAIRHAYTGRQLYRLFLLAGLASVEVADCSTLVLTDFATANQLYGLEDAATRFQEQKPALAEQVKNWLQELHQSDRDGVFFSAVTGFTIVGNKPVRSHTD
jgi:ubiquinone/menaquinone biosynthesis C-methylase UbiE